LISNALLLGGSLLDAFFALQLLVITLGSAGFILHGTRFRVRVLDKPYYFLLTNVASAMALIRYAHGEKMVTWKTVR